MQRATSTVVSTAARLALPQSPPCCPALRHGAGEPVPGLGLALCTGSSPTPVKPVLPGFLRVAFAAITPAQTLRVALAHTWDPLCSTWNFQRALQNAHRLQRGVENPPSRAVPWLVPRGTAVQPRAGLAGAKLPVPAAGWQQTALCCCPVPGGKDA